MYLVAAEDNVELVGMARMLDEYAGALDAELWEGGRCLSRYLRNMKYRIGEFEL